MTELRLANTSPQVNDNDGRLRIPLWKLAKDKRYARYLQRCSVAERNLRAHERNSYIIVYRALGVSARDLAADTGLSIRQVQRIVRQHTRRLITLWQRAREARRRFLDSVRLDRERLKSAVRHLPSLYHKRVIPVGVDRKIVRMVGSVKGLIGSVNVSVQFGERGDAPMGSYIDGDIELDFKHSCQDYFDDGARLCPLCGKTADWLIAQIRTEEAHAAWIRGQI